jgi:soluble lytic murein transglycosylase-like protein
LPYSSSTRCTYCRIPPYAETRQYVQRVLEEYGKLRGAARSVQ